MLTFSGSERHLEPLGLRVGTEDDSSHIKHNLFLRIRVRKAKGIRVRRVCRT